MTPQEEKLVLELHSQWGNRWSKIARRLPGRTDNEIKNYWRTHMRKKAQERKRTMTLSTSSSSISSSCSSPLSMNEPSNSKATTDTTIESFDSTRGLDKLDWDGNNNQLRNEVYSMDDIWKDITSSEAEPIKPLLDGYNQEAANFSCPPLASTLWEYTPEVLWKLDDYETKNMQFPSNDPFLPSYGP